jgi:VIT1/CCC1 family predicted Fe2+/Mn2+ transporter
MTGLIDGSLSTLAPIFAVALATHRPHYAFIAGLATAIGAGFSMAFSEGLSDSGDLTGRGNPYLRGSITGAGTFLGGILHTLPFLIPQYGAALMWPSSQSPSNCSRWRGCADGSSTPASCVRSPQLRSQARSLRRSALYSERPDRDE